MKKLLIALAAVPAMITAQTVNDSAAKPIFNDATKKYNDWSISFGGGASMITQGDLTSIRKGHFKPGWNAYVSLDKQITHEFTASVMYQTGKTEQVGELPMPYGAKSGLAHAWNRYHKVTLMADANMTQLMRRIMPIRPLRWAFHTYAGVGFTGYKTELLDNYASKHPYPITVEQKLDIASFVADLGVGLKYKISDKLDIEMRAMYTLTGDDEFDGGGDRRYPGGNNPQYREYNLIQDTYADNMFNVTLGLSFKPGRHKENLQWVDPMSNIYESIQSLYMTQHYHLLFA